tara:strand:+ start:481 stop:705 length:225 start_codon:yes stop_codon:yes gene_type:complete
MKKLHIIFIFFITCIWINPAFAYLDPGSGSALISVIIGFFVAISITLKTYWYKFKNLFGNKNNKTKDDKEHNKD